MEKKLNNIITAIQCILLVIMLGFHYISDKKMGIVRHLVFKNEGFTKINLDTKIMILLCIIIGNRVINALMKKKTNFKDTAVLILLILLTVLILYMRDIFRYSHYYLSMAMCVQCILQITKIYLKKE